AGGGTRSTSVDRGDRTLRHRYRPSPGANLGSAVDSSKTPVVWIPDVGGGPSGVGTCRVHQARAIDIRWTGVRLDRACSRTVRGATAAESGTRNLEHESEGRDDRARTNAPHYQWGAVRCDVDRDRLAGTPPDQRHGYVAWRVVRRHR